MAEPTFDRDKFDDVVHYVCASCEPSNLGHTKLHKVLYFFDMVSYAIRGGAPTGATYIKQKFGPTAQQLDGALNRLCSDGRITICQNDYYGYSKTTFLASRPAPRSRLTNEEIVFLDEVIDWVCQHNARQISEFSHNLAWDSVEFGEVISYRSAFLTVPFYVTEDAMTWAQGEADKVEAGPQKLLDAERLGNFRSRVLSIH